MGACLGTETLAAFVEGCADTMTRARIEEHGSVCESCRQVLSSLARSGTPLSSPRGRASVNGVAAPGTRIGRYVIAGEIGAGGMGVVYAARDPELGRMVAVKLLHADRDPRLQERLRREAQAMAQLAHPNVVAVHDVGVHGDGLFLAMEYIEGETLARWIATPRSLREILDVYRAAGRGLAAA